MVNGVIIPKHSLISKPQPRKAEDLKRLQALPLDQKVNLTLRRINEFYIRFNGKVYISYSGGKDSTVLLHLVRSLYPDTEAVFCNTGLEWGEVVEHVKTTENVTWLTPKKTFKQVIEDYGFPVVSKDNAQKVYEIRNTKSELLKHNRLHGDSKGNGKLPKKWHHLITAPFKVSHKCCDIMKKNPAKAFERKTGKKPFIGTMASESANRVSAYLRHGCNAYEAKRPLSTPLSFWTDEDIWAYINKHKLPYASIYDKGMSRTGCMWCLFGIEAESKVGENRFQIMKKTHPKIYDYCLNKLGIKNVLEYLNVPYA